MSDCCLTPIQKLFSYIMARGSQFSMEWWWGPLCTSNQPLLKNRFSHIISFIFKRRTYFVRLVFNTYCVVFVCCFVIVLCALCCQFLWIIHYWLLLSVFWRQTKEKHNMCWTPSVIVRVITPILYCIHNHV
jgi:hypothetical protein